MRLIFSFVIHTNFWFRFGPGCLLVNDQTNNLVYKEKFIARKSEWKTDFESVWQRANFPYFLNEIQTKKKQLTTSEYNTIYHSTSLHAIITVILFIFTAVAVGILFYFLFNFFCWQQKKLKLRKMLQVQVSFVFIFQFLFLFFFCFLYYFFSPLLLLQNNIIWFDMFVVVRPRHYQKWIRNI